MPTIVARNLIKLPNTASAVNDYYNSHWITLTRVDSFGKETSQTKQILDYDGPNRLVTIDGLWDADFTPQSGDTYKITPKFGDSRVSINPAMQSLDYISSRTYGRGLDPIKDLDLDSWLNSGRKCDLRSDVYVKLVSGTPVVGDVYILGSAAIFQGKVAEFTNGYVRFTDVIGKLAYAWNTWRSYTVGQLVHVDNRLYEVTSAGVKTTKPTHTSGTTSGLAFLSAKNLTRTSGTGSATLSIAVDGNPVRWVKNGVPASGYTLYDSDGVDYWRYIGWDSNDQRSVTRHQTNISVDTSLPLFDNMNSMLQHFGGMLRYSGDKYVLEVEEMVDDISTIPDEPRNITDDHIIGRISIQDEGIKSAYNSLTVSYADPANRFEPRNISFFNSEYLKADRNVPKKGNVTIAGITNYYNARLLADKYLTRSRFGLSINMNLRPMGALLLPGKVIQMQYPRYGWVDKKFRIENLTHNDDATVDIVATEYDDSFYVISNVARQGASGLAGEGALTTISPPTNITTTNVTAGNELKGAILITWENNPLALSPNVFAEIYASYSDKLTINIINVNSNVLTSSGNHNLIQGQIVYPDISLGNMIVNAPYYVKVQTATTFTLAKEKGGLSPNVSITNTSTPFTIRTGTVIATVQAPTSSYTDTDIVTDTGSRVEKYYWIRYKIN